MNGKKIFDRCLIDVIVVYNIFNCFGVLSGVFCLFYTLHYSKQKTSLKNIKTTKIFITFIIIIIMMKLYIIDVQNEGFCIGTEPAEQLSWNEDLDVRVETSWYDDSVVWNYNWMTTEVITYDEEMEIHDEIMEDEKQKKMGKLVEKYWML